MVSMGVRHGVAVVSIGAWVLLLFASCGGAVQSASPGEDGSTADSDAAAEADATVEGGSETSTEAMTDTAAPDVPSDEGEADAGAPDAADAATSIDAGAALAVCDAILGTISRSFDFCCSAADMTIRGYKNVHNLITTAINECDTNLSTSLIRARIRIDEAQTQACATAMATGLAATPACWPDVFLNRSSDSPATWSPAACQSPVVGQQAVGDPCFQDYECASGLTCVGYTGTTTDGRCETPPALGQPCGPAAHGAVTYGYPFGAHPSCQGSAFCQLGSICTAPVGADAGCDFTEACLPGFECVEARCSAGGYRSTGEACQGDNDCVEGTYCDLADASPGICTPLLAGGSPCNHPGADGHQCSGFCSEDAGTCVTLCGSQ